MLNAIRRSWRVKVFIDRRLGNLRSLILLLSHGSLARGGSTKQLTQVGDDRLKNPLRVHGRRWGAGEGARGVGPSA